jgi:hypothetical protein
MFTHAPVLGGVTDSNTNFFVGTEQATSVVLGTCIWQKFSYQETDCFVPDCPNQRYPRSILSSENCLRNKVCQVHYRRGEGSALHRGHFLHSLEGSLF